MSKILMILTHTKKEARKLKRWCVIPQIDHLQTIFNIQIYVYIFKLNTLREFKNRKSLTFDIPALCPVWVHVKAFALLVSNLWGIRAISLVPSKTSKWVNGIHKVYTTRESRTHLKSSLPSPPDRVLRGRHVNHWDHIPNLKWRHTQKRNETSQQLLNTNAHVQSLFSYLT